MSHIAHISLFSQFSLTFCLISLFSHKRFRAVFKMLQVQEDRIARKFDYGTLLYESRLPKDNILVRLYRHGNKKLTFYPSILTSHPCRGYLPSSTFLTIPTTSTCVSLSFPYLPQLSQQFVKLRTKLCTFQLKGSLRPTLPFLVVRPNRRDVAIRLGLLQLEVFLRDI